MAGGEGAVKPCGTRCVGTSGEGRATEPCPTKRKSPEEVVRGGQLFCHLTAWANKRKAAEDATGRKAAEDTTGGAAADAAGGKAANPGPLPRMSRREIRWILAQKPMAPPPRYQALKRSCPDLTPPPGEEMDEEKERLYFMANAFYQMEERFPKLQEWVREELRTKGYVEMDEDWVKRRAEAQEALEEGWKKIEAILLTVDVEDDDGEEEEEEEDEEE